MGTHITTLLRSSGLHRVRAERRGHPSRGCDIKPVALCLGQGRDG
jgi:hypothetical protein